MTAQSWSVPVIEYGIFEVRVATFLLLCGQGTFSPHRSCAISPLPQSVRPKIYSVASSGVSSPSSTHCATRAIAS